MEINELDYQVMEDFKKSPIYFIEKIWGLTSQAVKEECRTEVMGHVERREWDKVHVKHFEGFVKGKNITWQQWLLLQAVEQSIKFGNNKISVVAGHGVGKSSTLSWLLIWFLFCHHDAQVGATAPTSEQIHDVLWKEVSLWMGKMPKELQELFEWQSGYIRVKERPETWWARARTARKEAPEAIAGLHGENILIIADESSGIPDEIYRSAEGSMTGPNVLVILIGNGTRNTGYFYDTHHDDKANWQTFAFSSEDSPIVEDGYIERMESKYGRESEEFFIRVLGKFPASEQMDDKGWMPVLVDKHINRVDEQTTFIGRKIMAIDPSGEGDDLTCFVLRDNFQARVIATEATSSEKTIARRAYDLIKEYELDPGDVVVDNFGVGANVAKELLLLDHNMNIMAINWGEDAQDKDVYLNKRAECLFRARDWFLRGGGIFGDELRRDILSYTYRNNMAGKKQIVDKPKLKSRLGRSPDRGDAFFMTFYDDLDLRVMGGVMTQPKTDDLYSAI